MRFEKRLRKKLRITIGTILLAVGVLTLPSCGERPEKSGTTDSFTAELRGSMNGVEVTALVKVQRDGDICHEEVSYLSPPSLCGVTVGRNGGEASLTVGDLKPVSTPEMVSGLLCPAELLLTKGEYQTIRKDGGKTVVTYPGDICLTIENGRPTAVSSPSSSFEVVWWETLFPQNTGGEAAYKP